MTFPYKQFVKNVSQGITSTDVGEGKEIPSNSFIPGEIRYTPIRVEETEEYRKNVGSKDLVLSFPDIKNLISKNSDVMAKGIIYPVTISFTFTYYPLTIETPVAVTESKSISFDSDKIVTFSSEIDATKAFTISDLTVSGKDNSGLSTISFVIPSSSIRFVPNNRWWFRILYADRPESPQYPVIAMDKYGGQIITFNRAGESEFISGLKLVLQTEIPPNDVNPELVIAEKQYYKKRDGYKAYVEQASGERFIVLPVRDIVFLGERLDFFSKYAVWGNGMKNTTSDVPVQSPDDLVELWLVKDAKRQMFYAVVPDGEDDPRNSIKISEGNPSASPKNWRFYATRSEVGTVANTESLYEVHAAEIIYFTNPGLSYTLSL